MPYGLLAVAGGLFLASWITKARAKKIVFAACGGLVLVGAIVMSGL